MATGSVVRAMEKALSAARRASGRTAPNPPVGAAVFRGDRILGTGCTRPPGGPHAEIVALATARRRHGDAALRGASMAVTLEPCAHTGRTGPCADAVVGAGIAHVAIGHRDPHAEVSGRGIRRLQRAGVRVEVGILAERCREQHRGFVSVVERGRPWVSLKLAATLDGRIATASGESRWITGPESRAFVHRLRDQHDAVMVGSATVRSDDPALNVRHPDGRVKRWLPRVVVDGALRVSPKAALLNDPGSETTLCLTKRGHSRGRRSAREAGGARVLEVASRGGHIDLARGLARLAGEGLNQIWVEGGGGLAAALLRRGLIDEVHWFAAPALLGADARAAIGPLEVGRLAHRTQLEVRKVRRLGPDLYVHALMETPKPRETRG